MPTAAPAPRVRPFARKVVDEPTELTDRSLDELDGFDGFDDVYDDDGFGGVDDRVDVDDRMNVAAPRRPAPPSRGRRPGGIGDEDDDPVGADDVAGDDVDGRFDDDLDPDERDERGQREHDVEDRDDADDRDDDELQERTVRPAQAWAGVVAQWLAGAVAVRCTMGAVPLPLARAARRHALAAAVLVTAGLCWCGSCCQADRRTTGFAVLVGLLLAASPRCWYYWGDESARRHSPPPRCSRRRCTPGSCWPASWATTASS